jgi:hypothetical protein
MDLSYNPSLSPPSLLSMQNIKTHTEESKNIKHIPQQKNKEE